MNLSEQTGLAAYTGLVVGLVFGTVDCIVRLFSMSFEWFEFYQTLLISSVVFSFLFMVLGVFVYLASEVLKIKRDFLIRFYTLTGSATLLFFYGAITINGYLLSDIPMSDLLSIALNISFLLVLAVSYLYLLLKGRQLLLRIFLFSKKLKASNIIENLLFIAGVFVLVSFLSDWYLLTQTPAAQFDSNPSNYPNIVLITLDTVRADHINYNTAPNIMRLSERSVVFENAISPSSWTLPAHSSIFTGKHVSEHGAHLRHQFLEMNELTLAEILSERGYNTVGFVGGAYCKSKYGLGQGFSHYNDRLDFFEFRYTFNKFSIRFILNTIFPSLNKVLFQADGERTSEEINDDVFKWLERNNEGPFFLFINYFDAHDPYELGQDYRSMFTNDSRDYGEVEHALSMRINNRNSPVPEDLVEYMGAIYDAEIYYLDRQVGALLEKLDDNGLKDNTIIIITADHGEEFYDHGGFDHGVTLYDEVIHVPLIIHYPKEFPKAKHSHRMGTIDLFATVVEISGESVPEGVYSQSLLSVLRGGEKEESTILSELFGRFHLGETEQKALSHNSWKLIQVTPEKQDLSSSLFNLLNDPEEQVDLIFSNPIKEEELKEIASSLDK